MAKRSPRRAKTKRRARTRNQRQYQPSTAPLAVAFDHFNQELFDGILKRPVLKILPLRSSLGRFSFDGCRNTTEDTICIGVNHFKQAPQAEVLSTLVHEMCHQWQSNHGKMGRRSGYHNLQWAEKMEECGLMASTTGKPGGKKSGPRVSHYIIPDGVFEQSLSRLPSDFVLYQPPRPKAKTRVKTKTKTSPKAKTKPVERPPTKEPPPVAPVLIHPHKKRRPKKPLTFGQKIFLGFRPVLNVMQDQPVLTVLIVIAFLLVIV